MNIAEICALSKSGFIGRPEERRAEISISRTTDLQAIAEILSHDGVRDLVWDDSGPAALSIHEKIYYLMATRDVWDEGSVSSVPIGVMAFIPINAVTWNPHIAVLPKYRGTGTDVMRAGVDWIFTNTECKKLVAHPPEYNAAMIRVFEKCGFKSEGYSPRSILKGGTLHGRKLMGIEKWSGQQQQ